MPIEILDGGAFKRLARSLKKADPEVAVKLQKNNKDVGQKIVQAAKGRANALGSVQAKSSPAIRGGRAAAAVTVTLGGAARPYALGAEFGSKKYKQFDAWKGTMIASNAFAGEWGYFLGPAIRGNQAEIIATWKRGLDEILDDAFPSAI